VGRKGYEYFKTKTPSMGRYYQNFFSGLRFAKSQSMAEELIAQYTAGEYDQICFVYNQFETAISQKVTVERFLPVRIEGADTETSGDDNPVIYEPGQQEILDRLLPKHFATQIHRILLDSLASEHGARMSAMENATKNAGEMMFALSLEYNKTRQAGITKELLEIVSGSEAQKN
jgi:F-type H+-transporting ATPase subunit gamma